MKKLAIVLASFLLAVNCLATTTVSVTSHTVRTTALSATENTNNSSLANAINTHNAATTGEHGADGTILDSTSPIMSSPTFNTAATVNGDMSFATGVKAIFGNASRYIKDNTTKYAVEISSHCFINGNLVLDSATKFNLDGDSAGDTYLNYGGSNRIDAVAGGTIVTQTSTGQFYSSQDIAIPATKKIYLDGGTNTYITEGIGDRIDTVAGGTIVTQTNATGFYSSQDITVPSGKAIYLATGLTDYSINAQTSGAASSTLYIGNRTIDTTAVSDERLKKNIKPTKYGLVDLLKIEVKDFNYKSEYDNDTTTVHTGLIAQELQVIYPDAVKTLSDGRMMIEYKLLIPVLIKSIQDQQIEIDKLIKRIEKLEAK